jgi:hypothetical protein
MTNREKVLFHLTVSRRPRLSISVTRRTTCVVTFVLLLVGLLDVAVSYLAGHSFEAYLIENSDLLYLPTLFSDLIEKGGRLSDWFLTPAPYFFPDYPLYFIAYVLGFGTYSRVVLFSVTQSIVLFCALWLLATRVSRSEGFVAAATIAVALLWLALHDGEPFVILLASASHYGTFVSAIIFEALWMQYLAMEAQPRHGVWLGAMCMLAFLAALSDNLFIVQVICPFVATFMFIELTDHGIQIGHGRSRVALIAIWVAAALVVPALVYRVPIPPPGINVAWSPAVNDQQRATLETRFHLTDGDHRGGALWSYRLADITRSNVAALVQHPDVEDTEHIDRQSFTVYGASGPLWRAVSTIPIGLAISTLAVLCWSFAQGVLKDLRQHRSITRRAFALLPVLFSGLGFMSYSFLVHNPTRYSPSIGLEKAYGNLIDLSVGVGRTVTTNLAYGTVVVVYLGVVLFVLSERMWTNKRDSGQMVSLVVFSILSICSTLIAATLMTDLSVMARYLIPAFSWPVVMVVLYLARRMGPRFLGVGTAVSALVIVLLSTSAYNIARDNGVSTRFYPSDVACIDEVLEKEGLHNGIANYWDAKYLQQFSRLNLNLAQYSEDLVETKWITSERYFRGRYDFAILSDDGEPTFKISSDALVTINGSPKQVVLCGRRSLYIYGRDRLRTTASAADVPGSGPSTADAYLFGAADTRWLKNVSAPLTTGR